VILLVGLAAYSAFQARAYLQGPRIVIEETKQNGELLALSGTAERIAFLTLQGKQIYTNEYGVWQETILLNPGYNIIEVAAKDRFGREVKVHKDIYFTNPEQNTF
jgi:hypothetical protein